jgi:hypothetical protein
MQPRTERSLRHATIAARPRRRRRQTRQGPFLPPVIPVTFRNEIRSHAQDIGLFEASDDTSLVPTGYWNFGYTGPARQAPTASMRRISGSVARSASSARDGTRPEEGGGSVA